MDLRKHFFKSYFEKFLYEQLLDSGNTVFIDETAQYDIFDIDIKQKCCLVLRKNSILNGRCVFEKDSSLISIGERTYIGAQTLLAPAKKIVIGNDVLIAWGCTIVDHDSHSLYFSERSKDVLLWRKGREYKDWSSVAVSPVTIQDKAWIGFNAAILKGVTVGEGAVVAACSVVTRNVPDYTVVAGNPAKIIKNLDKK